MKEFYCTMTEPSVTTSYGRLRGYRYGKIYSFFGVDYAKAKRFHMPEEPDSWDGLRDATTFGPVAPLLTHTVGADSMRRRFWPESEDCQSLNIWTPSIDPNAKKPVLVWLHGGGYFAGSTLNHECYDGYELSDFGDCVVVSVNHRLNVLGFFDFSSLGEEYHNSGNLGVADMETALRYIQKNISAFGGDPDNVTICGQSGGGGKVTTLMQTPSADGLFHKAFVMSGVCSGIFKDVTEERAVVAKMILEEAGVSSMKELEEIPWEHLAEATNKAVDKFLKMSGEPTLAHALFVPTPNDYYVGDPLYVGFTEHAKTIPMVVGSNFGEFKASIKIANRATMPREEAMKLIEERYGDAAESLAEQFHAAYPEKNIAYLLNLDVMGFRNESIKYLECRAATCSAPTYAYMFALTFKIDDDRPCWHSGDMPYLFHDVETNPVCCIPGVSERAQDQLAGAWVNLGKNADPSGPWFDEPWRPYTLEDRATMVIDRKSGMRVDYDRALITRLANEFIEDAHTSGAKDHRGNSAVGH